MGRQRGQTCTETRGHRLWPGRPMGQQEATGRGSAWVSMLEATRRRDRASPGCCGRRADLALLAPHGHRVQTRGTGAHKNIIRCFHRCSCSRIERLQAKGRPGSTSGAWTRPHSHCSSVPSHAHTFPRLLSRATESTISNFRRFSPVMQGLYCAYQGTRSFRTLTSIHTTKPTPREVQLHSY